MATVHTQLGSDYLSATSQSRVDGKSYGEARKVKTPRARKPVKQGFVEITPVFVGIAG